MKNNKTVKIFACVISVIFICCLCFSCSLPPEDAYTNTDITENKIESAETDESTQEETFEESQEITEKEENTEEETTENTEPAEAETETEPESIEAIEVINIAETIENVDTAEVETTTENNVDITENTEAKNTENVNVNVSVNVNADTNVNVNVNVDVNANIDANSVEENQITEILISAIGDCSLASNYVKPYAGSFNSYYDTYGAKYFFENVSHIFKDDDITVANLECALTESDNRLNKQYCYKGKKEYSSILVEGSIEVVNLENNHSGDYSAEGYDDTIDSVKSAGIDYFGNGVIAIKEIKGIKIGLIAFMGSSDVSNYRLQRLKNDLAYLDENGADIKIVNFHWGNVDEKIANDNQRLLAHFAVDNGADLVLGHHPHVLQGIEVYNGKYIVYSLGNFIFDGNMISDEEHRSTIIFQQKFILDGKTIIDKSAVITPVYATSNLSVNNFQPMLVDGEKKERILQKIAERSPQ